MAPFGKWDSFNSCVSDMMNRYKGKKGFKKENAERICGALKAKFEK